MAGGQKWCRPSSLLSPLYTEFIEPPPPLSPSRGWAIGIDPANRDYTGAGVDLLMEPHFEKAVPDDARTAHFKKPTSAATPSFFPIWRRPE